MDICTPSSSSYELEVTILSAESLALGRRRSSKKNMFVIVHTDPYIHQATSTNSEAGSSYPVWNEKLLICMPMHAKFITLAVYYQYKTYLSGNNKNKMIGMVSIPVSDFIGGYMPRNHLHLLSYRLRDQYGYKNGIINFSVRVKGRVVGDEKPPSWPGNPDVRVQQSSSSGRPDHVVNGIPAIWFN